MSGIKMNMQIDEKNKIYRLLRWSEKWTHTDMVYLAKGGFWLIFGQIITAVGTLVLALVFANFLPKESYGTYKYVISLATILSIPTLLGINTAITQATAKGLEGSLLEALKTKIKWGLIGGLISLGLAIYNFINFNNTLFIAFSITAIFIPFMESFLIYSSYLEGKKKFKESTKYIVSTQIIATFLLIITILFTKNLLLLIFIYFASYTVLRLIFFKKTIIKFRPNDKKSVEVMPYGKHLSLMGVISIIASHIDKILIFSYLGAIQLAIYTFAITIPQQLSMIFGIIPSLAMPKFAEKNREEIKKSIFKKTILLAIILIIIVIIYILIAPFVYKLLFPQYLESIKYSQIFSISIIPLTLLLLTNTFLRAHSATRQLYQYNIYSSLAQIVIMFFLIRTWGLIGAVYAKVISGFIYFGISTYLAKKHLKN